jgi:hypothetical protein
LITLAIMAMLAARVVCAQCTKVSPNFSGTPYLGRTIGLIAKEDVTERDIAKAVAIWQRGCGAMFLDEQLPQLLTNRKGDRNVYVTRHPDTAPRTRLCGLYSQNRIDVWAFTQVDGVVVQCPATESLIAHEIGHVLSLGDAPEDPACTGQMMAQIALGSGIQPALIESECRLATLTNTPLSPERMALAVDGGYLLSQPSRLLARPADTRRVETEVLTTDFTLVETTWSSNRSSPFQSRSSNGQSWWSQHPSEPWPGDRDR